MTVADMLRWHARYRPTKDAIVERGSSISYGSLDRIVDGVCHALTARGIGRGDLVGVSLADDARHVVVLLALGRIGAVLLPLDRRWNLGETSAVVERFAANAVLTDQSAAPVDWLRPAEDWFAGSDTPHSDAAVTDDSPMVLSLSSGTTGLPKGPRLTHRQFTNRFMVYWIDIGLGSSDRFVTATPLYFGGGRAFVLAMIFAGGTACLFPPPYEPQELVDFVSQSQGTSMFLVPTLMRRLLQHDFAGLAFPRLRALISSGSALYAAEARAIRERLTPNLFQYYASTEAGGVSLLSPDDYAAHGGSVGRPCFGVNVEVVDDDHRSLPADAIGQLRYRSPASPDHYHMGDGSAAFRDGWFYPGDLASFDSDGYLYLRGRAKDMIIRGGVNIYPADIEQVLLDAPAVAEAAVIGAPSAEFGEQVAAFVVRAGPIGEPELRAICAARLARYKVPEIVVFVDAIPKNSAGKVLKAELARMLPTN
jgi:acyl-CoA synthetase (AMP-forming)/AMP-acid ligase II